MIRTFSALVAPLAIGVFVVSSALAQDAAVRTTERKDLSVTLYQQDLGLVSETRPVDLAAGVNQLTLENVSDQIQPETVLLRGAGTQVTDQVYAYGLLSQQALLQTHLGGEVWWRQINPQTGEKQLTEATLLAAGAPVLIEVDGRIESVDAADVVFPGLGDQLLSQPALLARVSADQAGAHDLSLQYLSSGLGWRADYVAELSEAGNKMNLTALVSLRNDTRVDFNDAAIRLVAGNVSQVQPAPLPQAAAPVMRAEMMAADVGGQSVSDRYLYTLPGRYDLASRETKQVPLFVGGDVAVERIYRFDGLVNLPQRYQESQARQASLVLSIDNSEAAGLGRPLPAGNFRVYEALPEAAGQLFAGASPIGHTPEGETFEVVLGQAFDVTAEAKRTHFERLSNETGAYEAAEEVVLKNAKPEPVTVEVVGYLPQGWKMLSESAPHEKRSASKLVWQLEVPAGGETKLDYRFRVRP